MRKLLLLLCVGIWSQSALADYAAALAAMRDKDYASAEPLLQEAARNGEPRAWNALGVLYLEGMGVDKDEVQALGYFGKAAAAGNVNAYKSLINMYAVGSESVPKNPARARTWALKLAQTNNNYAAYTFYQLAVQNELNVLDEKGQIDRARYADLAKRSIQERDLDSQAYSLLSFAAERGYAPAVAEAQSILLSRSGEAVSERALLFDEEIQDRYATKLAAQTANSLQQEAEKLDKLRRLGSSFVSVRLFNLVLPKASAVAYTASNTDPQACPRNQMRVSQMRITQPMQEAQYLPVNGRLLGNMLLIKGHWSESWTLNVCGKAVEVPVTFEADGLATAEFSVDAAGARSVTP